MGTGKCFERTVSFYCFGFICFCLFEKDCLFFCFVERLVDTKYCRHMTLLHACHQYYVPKSRSSTKLANHFRPSSRAMDLFCYCRLQVGGLQGIALALSAVLPRIQAWLRFYARAEPPASPKWTRGQTRRRRRTDRSKACTALAPVFFFFLTLHFFYFPPTVSLEIINCGSPPLNPTQLY
jgi:hypothetical protein